MEDEKAETETLLDSAFRWLAKRQRHVDKRERKEAKHAQEWKERVLKGVHLPTTVRCTHKLGTRFYSRFGECKTDPKAQTCALWEAERSGHRFMVIDTERARVSDVQRVKCETILADPMSSAKDKKKAKRQLVRDWRSYGGYATARAFWSVMERLPPARRTVYQFFPARTQVGTYLDLEWEVEADPNGAGREVNDAGPDKGTHSSLPLHGPDHVDTWNKRVEQLLGHFHRVLAHVVHLTPEQNGCIQSQWYKLKRHRKKGSKYKFSTHLVNNALQWQDVRVLGLFLVVVLALDDGFLKDPAMAGQRAGDQDSREPWGQRPPLYDTTVYTEGRNYLCPSAYKATDEVPCPFQLESWPKDTDGTPKDTNGESSWTPAPPPLFAALVDVEQTTPHPVVVNLCGVMQYAARGLAPEALPAVDLSSPQALADYIQTCKTGGLSNASDTVRMEKRISNEKHSATAKRWKVSKGHEGHDTWAQLWTKVNETYRMSP
jgi:hypothetical protein